MDTIEMPGGEEVQQEQSETMKKSQKNTNSSIRWTQVLEIQAALEAGTYQINYDELATKMLKSKHTGAKEK